jgi:predicted negative regulator of RcsB-dependent stress response
MAVWCASRVGQYQADQKSGAPAELGQFKDARHCIDEAIATIDTTKEKWFEAEVHRMAGEIALLSREPNATKAEANFKRAHAIALDQQARS